MAKQISIITFTGKLGNLIGYRRNGKHFVRSMPTIVKQTVATRHAAQRFGMASKKAALIRHAFCSKLNVCCDTGHVNRLTSALIPSAGKDIKSITGFRFNGHTGTDRFLTLPPVLSRDGTLRIPPQVLAAHKGSHTLEIKVTAVRIHFATNQVIGAKSTVLQVKTGEPFKGLVSDMHVPGKGTLMIMLQIRGIQHNVPTLNKSYLAADIIAVQPPQTLPQVSPGLARPKRPLLQSFSTEITGIQRPSAIPQLE